MFDELSMAKSSVKCERAVASPYLLPPLSCSAWRYWANESMKISLTCDLNRSAWPHSVRNGNYTSQSNTQTRSKIPFWRFPCAPSTTWACKNPARTASFSRIPLSFPPFQSTITSSSNTSYGRESMMLIKVFTMSQLESVDSVCRKFSLTIPARTQTPTCGIPTRSHCIDTFLDFAVSPDR